jgi:hypothetical protein
MKNICGGCRCMLYAMPLHSSGHLQDSTVALVIDVHNMWEVSMEGSHTSLEMLCLLQTNFPLFVCS